MKIVRSFSSLIKGGVATLFTATVLCANVFAVPVIPGGAGFGIETPAGRGGAVIRVTNLNDSGAGSLRACVEAFGPRICVFEVSGVIKLNSTLLVNNSFITIAGQTAPSPGIMLRGQTLQIRASDVLIQHIVVRVGDGPDAPRAEVHDALRINGPNPINNVVIDHCSFSWAMDEIAQVWAEFDNITWSNNVFSEPLFDSLHTKGPHSMGPLLDTSAGKIALIGNLIAHANNRNPRTGAGTLMFVNNVTYNRGQKGMVLFNAPGLPSTNTIVGNVFKDGPNTSQRQPITLDNSDNGKTNGMLQDTRIHVADNIGSGATSDPWSLVQNTSDVPRSDLEWLTPPVWLENLTAKTTANDVVLNSVLENAGSRPADRDTVDTRVINEVRIGVGQIINCVAADGTERCQKNGGGWPQYAQNTRTLDVPSNPSGDDDGDGYTNVEEWLHTIAAEVEGRFDSEPDLGDRASPKPNPPEILGAN